MLPCGALDNTKGETQLWTVTAKNKVTSCSAVTGEMLFIEMQQTRDVYYVIAKLLMGVITLNNDNDDNEQIIGTIEQFTINNIQQ